jgi:osmotically-inducible protein OsmY
VALFATDRCREFGYDSPCGAKMRIAGVFLFSEAWFAVAPVHGGQPMEIGTVRSLSPARRSGGRTAVGDPVVQAAQQQLADSGYGTLRRIQCEFHEGVLTLRGRVSCFYLKQVAQTQVARVPGVQIVTNRIEVASCK